MARRLILRLIAGIALIFTPLAFGPIAEAATPGGIHTAQDLFDVCADTSAATQAACDAYVHATLQTAELLRAAAAGGKPTPLFCPGDQMGSQDLVAVLRLQAIAHPERRDFPAPTVILGGGVDAYPCPKAAPTAAAPAHRSKARRSHP